MFLIEGLIRVDIGSQLDAPRAKRRKVLTEICANSCEVGASLLVILLCYGDGNIVYCYFFHLLTFSEPRDYRVVFFIQKQNHRQTGGSVLLLVIPIFMYRAEFIPFKKKDKLSILFFYCVI